MRPEDRISGLLAAMAGMTVHDASPVIDADLQSWFAYDPPQIQPLFAHAEVGAAANRLIMAEHSGTHIDAPFHFDPDGATVDELPADALLLRPYKKYDLTSLTLVPGEQVTAGQLRAAGDRRGITLEHGDVAIIEMGWDRHLPDGSDARPPGWWGRNQPGLTPDACDMLADAGVIAVASDTAACDIAVIDGQIISEHGHRHAFLPQGILIVEGLRGLAEVPSSGLLIAVPLRIARGTGSPVRVLLLSA